MKKYALITGTSGGIGKATAMRMLQAGFEVFGCDLRTSDIQDECFHGLIMDVTSTESIRAAYERVSAVTDRLDAVINVAGIMFMGSLIEENPDRMQKIIDVNLLGMCRVNQIFFPMVEKAKGRYLNFSSEYGTYAVVPFNGFYTATKHAVESYSDGLRRELKYIGIPVITIRPGAFKTEMESSTADIFQKITEKSTHYKDILGKMGKLLINGTKNAKNPDCMAQITVQAATDAKPKRVYKCNHNLGVKIMSLLPMGCVDAIFYNMFK